MTTIDVSEAVGVPAMGDRGGVWVARLQRMAAFGLRWLLVLLLALIAFGIVLLFSGRNPLWTPMRRSFPLPWAAVTACPKCW